jgi:hypothetical protein
VFRRRPFFSPIWNVADELGPYVEKIGVRLFGCHIPEEYWNFCIGPQVSVDLSAFLPIMPRNTCARSASRVNGTVDGDLKPHSSCMDPSSIVWFEMIQQC